MYHRRSAFSPPTVTGFSTLSLFECHFSAAETKVKIQIMQAGNMEFKLLYYLQTLDTTLAILRILTQKNSQRTCKSHHAFEPRWWCTSRFHGQKIGLFQCLPPTGPSVRDVSFQFLSQHPFFSLFCQDFTIPKLTNVSLAFFSLRFYGNVLLVVFVRTVHA